MNTDKTHEFAPKMVEYFSVDLIKGIDPCNLCNPWLNSSV